MDPNQQQPGAPMPPQGAPMTQPAPQAPFTAPQPQQPQYAQPQAGAPYMPPQGAPHQQNANIAATLSTRIQLGKLHIIYADFITFFGALLGVIAVFVPFFSSKGYSSETLALIASDSPYVFFGWQFLVLTVAIAGLAFIDNKAVPLTLAVVYAVLFIDQIAWGTFNTHGYANYHVGFYLMLFAVIFMLAGTIIAMWLESQQTKLRNGTAQPAAPIPAAYPAPTSAYVNNGWQSGVPPTQPVGTTDNSNWQFGVPNQPQTPAPTAPMAPGAPTGQFAAPAAPAAPSVPAAPAAPTAPGAPTVPPTMPGGHA